MSLPGLVPGMPRIGSRVNTAHRIIFRNGDWISDLAGGKMIDGTYSRDSGNTSDLNVLRAGLLMGKITSGGKYAPSIIGVSTGAVVVSATTITVSAAQAVELVRRVGSTGTFVMRGPAAANGFIQNETVTYSAVNTTTGAITVTAITNAYVAGSFVMPTDGSDIPLSLIPDGYGVLVTDTDGTTNLTVPFTQMPIAGVLISANIILWPSDTSLRAWIVNRMSDAGGGKFVFDHTY